MVTLKIEDKDVSKLFSKVPDWFQKILKDSAGDKLCSGKLIDRVSGFEDLLQEASFKTQADYYRSIQGDRSPDEIANAKIKLVSSVAWESIGKTVDWKDSSQKKYWPRFIMAPVFRFLDSTYYYGFSLSGAGSRLSFPLEEMSDFFGKLLIDIYKDLQN